MDERFTPRYADIPRKWRLIFMVGWVILIALGFSILFQFTEEQKEINARQWQRQLQLTAENQKRQIERWIRHEQSVIDGLANNTSLRLYLTELQATSRDDADSTADPAFTSFLRSLVISEAEQHGYYEPSAAQEIPANLPPQTGAGIAIYTTDYAPLVGTVTAPALSDLPALVQVAIRQETLSPIGPFTIENGDAYLLFRAPIAAIQSDGAQGHIIGVKPFEKDLQEILKLPPQAAESAESLLVQRQEQTVEYITMLQDGTDALAQKLNFEPDVLAEAFAIENPGVFAAKRDYEGNEVIAVGQPIDGTDWTLVHKVNRSVAYDEATNRQRTLLAAYFILAFGISAVLIATWRNMAANRARQDAMYFREMSAAMARQKSLLSHLINTLIMLVDSRDPHAQNHSNRVSMVAEAVAKHMALDRVDIETTRLAASLMNVGKIKTPETMLTEKDLSPQDRNSIRQSILASADILREIAFEGPVVQTLQQSLEHVNGSGPLGLKENDILVTAKIVSVANAFIAMISDRAYRKAMTIDAALDVIHESIDTKYARSVVAALEHYLENDGGREACTYEAIKASETEESTDD